MRTRMWRGLIASVVCLGLPASYAFAQGHGHGHGGKDKDSSERVVRDRHHDRERVRERRKEVVQRHVHKGGPGHVELGHIFPEPERRPPGWDKGKKTGWGDCDVPPGQAKKVGCNPVYRTRRRTRSTVVVQPPVSQRVPSVVLSPGSRRAD
ncbi:MAG: hypothetical protein ACE14M_07060 [Terriglobales bacterium]